MFKIINNKPMSALENMKFDSNLLDNLKDDIILHFYNWKNPSITYGYFIDIDKYLDTNVLDELSIDYARRPTGGGIVFHMWDLAFSCLIPRKSKFFFADSIANYGFVNSIVLKAVKNFFLKKTTVFEKKFAFNNLFNNFCMASPTKYDVVIDGKKIAGASQRCKKNGYLHQGTIACQKPDYDLLEKILKKPNKIIIEEMQKRGFFEDYNKEDLKKALIEQFQKKLQTFSVFS